ncbi:hypothetical protein CLOM_g11808 [Closterium sp. NIES-68]|nr:hypothetical protein CLOM_g22657 [Closterium sp. NIES-68]GJP52719.1 hypothetical protein CLOM_g11808 [Closterium sp. NIES-68]GJP63761.1 hypothetical protein CLOP_g20808 [Closterium sp. NIES-67]
MGRFPWLLLALVALLWADSTSALVFTLLKRECFQHFVPTGGEPVHVSFVVVKSDFGWVGGEQAKIDLTVEDPRGHELRKIDQRTDDNFMFTAAVDGFFKFCFKTDSAMHESVAFNVENGHPLSTEHVARNDQIDPLVKEVNRLHREVMRTKHEIHYSFYIAEQHAQVDRWTAQRVLAKAVLQAGALVTCGIVQVFLLQRLFEKRLKMSRV